MIGVIVESNKEYTSWDYLCLACEVLMVFSEELHVLKPAIKHIVSTLVTSSIDEQELKNKNVKLSKSV